MCVSLLLLLLNICVVSALEHFNNYSSFGYLNHTNATYYNYTNTVSSDDFVYRGVALGGWLVLEPYITPSLFLAFNETSRNSSDIPKDEYHFCKELGHEEASARLKEHWDTFYNELDFEDIKNYGLNMVRIPVGYWSFRPLMMIHMFKERRSI